MGEFLLHFVFSSAATAALMSRIESFLPRFCVFALTLATGLEDDEFKGEPKERGLKTKPEELTPLTTHRVVINAEFSLVEYSTRSFTVGPNFDTLLTTWLERSVRMVISLWLMHRPQSQRVGMTSVGLVVSLDFKPFRNMLQALQRR
jgi:UDP-N-acetylmuramyl pentapeptide phosphotransferase/UDP-N-acetylglucosamine-1-phosphate transferase